MENVADFRHQLHATEERLLTKLRSLRRDLRKSQGHECPAEGDLTVSVIATAESPMRPR